MIAGSLDVDVAARLAVLLSCAVVAGVLLVRLAGSAPTRGQEVDPTRPIPGGLPAPIAGAMEATLAAYLVVAGGAVVTGIGLGSADSAPATLVRAAGIGLLATAGGLALLRLRPGRRRPTAQALVAMTWIGAGLALAAPLVLLIAAAASALLAIRVDRPAPP
jgi:hypothetical protein